MKIIIRVYIGLALFVLSINSFAKTCDSDDRSDKRRFNRGADVKVILDLRGFETSFFDPILIEDVRNITMDSIDTWNAVGANIKLYWGGLKVVGEDYGKNTITVTGSTRPPDGWFWPVAGSSIAFTTAWWDWDLEADDEPTIHMLRKNDDGEINWTHARFREVLLHEMGHAMGLGHDCSEKDSLMKPAGSGHTIWFPRKVDVYDLIDLYGRRQYSFEIFSTRDGNSWETVPSNLSLFGNVFTTRPFSVVSSGYKAKYRDRFLFFTDTFGHPTYVVSQTNEDGTISNNFDITKNGQFFNSTSLGGTTADTDDKGEYMIAWLEQGSDDYRHLRVRHNDSNLDRKLWVDVDPIFSSNLAVGAPAIAHIKNDTWVLFAAMGDEAVIGYFITHDDGDTWTKSSVPGGPFSLLLKWAGENISTATTMIDAEYNEPYGLRISFPYRNLGASGVAAIQNYTPVVVHAEVKETEIAVRSLAFQPDIDPVRSKISIESNDQIFMESFLSEQKEGLDIRVTDNILSYDAWGDPFTIINTGQNPDLTANTGLDLEDCSSISSGPGCVEEALNGNKIFLYRLVDQGGYDPEGDGRTIIGIGSAATIERSPLSKSGIANADYEIFLRDRSEWPTGGVCADIVVTNNGDTRISPWKIVIDGIPGEIFDFWNVDWVQNGDSVIATPATWVGWPDCCTLDPGEETNKWDFGFCSSLTEIDDAETVPLPNQDVIVEIYDRFNGGYCAYLTAQNISDERKAWQVDFQVLGEFYNTWNFEIVAEPEPNKTDWRTITAKGVGWNSFLDPGEISHDIGFCVRNNFGGTNQPE